MAQAIVVGGGLAGMSAAHTVLQSGGRVLVLDKSAFCGGNSTKATSGINAAGTRSQRAAGIHDSPEDFERDTTASAASGARPDLIRTLTHESGPAVEWLIDSFGLDLSVVGLMAAHSHPRTHRGKDGSESFPGMMITYRLMEKYDELVADGTGRARLVNKATVLSLLRDGDKVVGVEYEKDGQRFKEYGPVIIATGGFGADFTADSLLARVESEWRTLPIWKDVPLPPLLSLPTTNGPHCTGDVSPAAHVFLVTLMIRVYLSAVSCEAIRDVRRRAHVTRGRDALDPDADVFLSFFLPP
jgi:succinate dehydrogenase/fumarate reductase flavoprotein subunit